jgi:hypothetical protein
MNKIQYSRLYFFVIICVYYLSSLNKQLNFKEKTIFVDTSLKESSQLINDLLIIVLDRTLTYLYDEVTTLSTDVIYVYIL